MTAKYHQISFNDIFSDYQNKLIDDSPSFFYMLSEHVNLNEFIPPKFQSALYLSVGRTHIYPLHDFHFSKVLIPYNPRNESSLKKMVTMHMVIQPVLKLITIMAGSMTAINRATLLKMAEPLILIKIWIYICFPVSSVTQKNGMTLIK